MKDLGQLYHFLRVKIVQDRFTGLIWIRQPSYTEKVLHQFGMNECKPVSTPANSNINPASASLEDVCNQKEYQAVVGSLLYLSTRTQPDIAFAVGAVLLVFVPIQAKNSGQQLREFCDI